jgi:hypothetical protein
MGNWEPIFWIIGGSLTFFAFLILVEFLKSIRKSNNDRSTTRT